MAAGLSDLEERVRELESQVELLPSAIEDATSNMPLIGEALDIVRRVLADIIDRFPEEDQSQYDDDLDRLNQLAHLLS